MNAIVEPNTLEPNALEPLTARTPSAGVRFLRRRLVAQLAGLRHGRLVLRDALGTVELGTPAALEPELVVHIDEKETLRSMPHRSAKCRNDSVCRIGDRQWMHTMMTRPPRPSHKRFATPSKSGVTS